MNHLKVMLFLNEPELIGLYKVKWLQIWTGDATDIGVWI